MCITRSITASWHADLDAILHRKQFYIVRLKSHRGGARKGASIRDTVALTLYACGGDETQYDETVDTIVGAVETYLAQLAIVAARIAKNPDQVGPKDVIQTMSNEASKQAYLTRNLSDFEEHTKALGKGG